MSPSYYNIGIAARVFIVYDYGSLDGSSVSGTRGVRPVINLRADVQLTGTGSQNDPFVVVTS